MALHGRALVVPPGLPLERHSAVAQELLASFLADVADAELRLASKPRMRVLRATLPWDVELADGTILELNDRTIWAVEANVEP